MMANDLIIRLPKFAEKVSIRSEWIEQRDYLIRIAEEIKAIETQKDFELGSEILRSITKVSNSLEKMRKELTDPFENAKRVIKQKSDEAREVLEKRKAELQIKLAAYVDDQRKKAEEEKRLNEEKQREEIERQLAEKEALEEAGLVDKNSEFVPEVTTFIPESPEVSSNDVRVQQDVEWELLDENKIPGAFKTFDPRKVNGWLKDNKARILISLKENQDSGKEFIPGIIFKPKTKVIGR